jgi:MtrB/PioB family decaheme-associated outer membrane protein
MHRTIAFALVGALLAVPAAHAQQRPSLQPTPELLPEPRPPAGEATQPAAPATFGSIDLGFRGTTTSGDAAEYERYRDLRSGSWSRLLFDKDTDTYLFGARAQNIGYRDQRFATNYRGGKGWLYGSFDSIPTNYSYLTSTPWVEQTPGVLTLDVAARQLVQAGTVVGVPQTPAQVNTPSIYRSIANPFNLESLRQTGAFSGAYEFSRNLTLDGGFSSAKREGHQPWGASFAFNVANEVPLPVNSRTNDANVGLEWTRSRGMFRVGWNGSFYDNHVKSLVWDNAFRATDTNPFDPNGYSNGNGPAQGRMSVPPSNMLNAVNAFGMYKLQPRTVVNGALTFTRMSQNDPLIPWTINPVIQTPAVFAAFPNLAALPRATAEAKVDGLNAILNFTTRPSRFWGITARYRYNNHDNKTPTFDGTQYVRFDAVPENTGGFSEQFNIKENLADVNVNFNVLPYTTLRVGYGYDSFDRTGRSFSNMTDNTVRTSIDTVGNQWVTVRALYEFTDRKGSGFSQDALEDGGFQPGLRFYDEADRTRHRGTLLFVVTPKDTIDVTFSLAAGADTYSGPGHEFGLLDNNNRAYNTGIDFYPSDALSFGANYGRDHFDSNQKSRNANPPPDPQFTDPSRDWMLKNTENVNNFNLYADLPKLARKTNARVTYDFSDSDNGFAFSGPRILSLAAAGQFIPLPNVTNSWNRIGADVQYFFVPRVGFAVDYWYERFNTKDFNTIDIPGQPGTPRIDYLGEISTGYGNRPYRGTTAFVRLLYLF